MMTYRHAARRRVGAAIALVAALGFVVLTPARVVAMGTYESRTFYGYPYPNAPDCNEQNGNNCAPDQWGFVQGQCHSWVAFRLDQLNAAELHGAQFDDHYRQPSGQEWGSTWHWGAAAAAAHIRVDDRPALGSVAWWSQDGGHVGYVEAVSSDGSVLISEMNFNLHNGFDFATLRRGHRWPTGFIHIADRPAGNRVPGAPGGVHPVAKPGRVNLSWTSASNGGSAIKAYVIGAYRGSALADRVVVGRVNHTNITGLAPGSYTFVVLARNAVGAGPLSGRSATVTVH